MLTIVNASSVTRWAESPTGPAARLVLLLTLAVGLIGAMTSVSNKSWFSGSTADAGMIQSNPHLPY